jgi:hypothetical protein
LLQRSGNERTRRNLTASCGFENDVFASVIT